MKTNYGIQKLLINFNTHFSVQLITNISEEITEEKLKVRQEKNHFQDLSDEGEEEENDADEEGEIEDEELFVLITNE